MKTLLIILLFSAMSFAGDTTPLFQPANLTVGPFPSNALTVAASDQATGRQVNLPSTNCSPGFSGAVCGDVSLINVLDGFSTNPRSMICFSAAVNPSTIANGVYYLSLTGPAVTINQLFYDPSSNCAFFKPDQVLQQRTTYLLVVTDSVQDSKNQKIKESQDLKQCLLKTPSDFCGSLAQTITLLSARIPGNLVGASVFTTMSATNWLEKARQFAAQNEPAIILPAGAVSSFQVSKLTSMTWFPQDDSGSSTPTSFPIPLSALGNVGSVAFGMFLSPNFLNVSGPAAGSITVTPTAEPIQPPVPVPGLPSTIPKGYVPVSFHVFLPPPNKSPSAASGFPVVIYGHGLGDNQFGAPTYFASTLAANGFAVLAFEITGHGYGPGSVVQLTDTQKNSYVVSTPGRGVQLGSGPIGPTDGCILPGALAVRDCGRQSAVDLFALVSFLHRVGARIGIDPSRIYYAGQSFGSIYGTLFHAVEPTVQKAVMSGAGGTSVDIARLAITGRPLGIEYLAGFSPPLLNVPPAPPEAYFHDSFNDNYVFRDQPPVVNTIQEAPAIQAAFELADWTGTIGDALAFAPLLRASPSASIPAKSTLFLFGLGDLEVPNPTESAIVRAANALSSTWYFRFDIASLFEPVLLGVESPGGPFPILPHRILSNPTIFSVPAETSIALAEQQQAAAFFEGASKDPNTLLTAPFSASQGLFQNAPTLPESLNFLQIPK
jgi:hypothetical protein